MAGGPHFDSSLETLALVPLPRRSAWTASNGRCQLWPMVGQGRCALVDAHVGRLQMQPAACAIHRLRQPLCPAKACTAQICVCGVALVVRAQSIHATVTPQHAPSLRACVFKANVCASRTAVQQVTSARCCHVSPTLPSSGRAYGPPLMADDLQPSKPTLS
jgi:hypothetical protein